MPHLIFRSSLQPLNPGAILEFERHVRLFLPEDYSKFLLQHNGGTPNLHILAGTYIQFFYGITFKQDRLSLLEAIQSTEMPAGVIPIGDLGEGGDLCMELNSSRIFRKLSRRDYSDPPEVAELEPLAEGIEEMLRELDGEPAFLTPDPEIIRIGRWHDVDHLDKYLGEGHDINERTLDGSSIVESAVYTGDLQFIKDCRSRGAILTGRRLLHAAIFTMNYDIVKYLIEEGVDPNELNEHGRTPLDEALPPGVGAAVDLLKKYGGATSNEP
jgi:hypothetical protein